MRAIFATGNSKGDQQELTAGLFVLEAIGNREKDAHLQANH